MSACESFPDGLPFALSATATSDRRWRRRLQRKKSGDTSLTVEDSLESFWKSAVLNYTSCELTNQADKTFAIWSVAKLVRDHLQSNDEYGHGLWATVLHEQLAWRVKFTRKNARMHTLQSVFPSWSWASVNAPIQLSDRLVDVRSYTIKNHDKKLVAFEELIDKAVNRDLQPEFAASDALAVCGHLIPGQLQPSGENYTFAYKPDVITQQTSMLEVILDEEPIDVPLKAHELYFLPLAARETQEEGNEIAGSALVLIATHDVRQMLETKLKRQIIELSEQSEYDAAVTPAVVARQTDLRILRMDIQAMNAWLHKKAKQDRDLPVRIGRAFRRIGVVRFTGMTSEEWAQICGLKEKSIWLN